MTNKNLSQTNRFRQTLLDNRRKMNEVMTQLQSSSSPRKHQSSIIVGGSDRNMKP